MLLTHDRFPEYVLWCFIEAYSHHVSHFKNIQHCGLSPLFGLGQLWILVRSQGQGSPGRLTIPDERTHKGEYDKNVRMVAPPLATYLFHVLLCLTFLENTINK